MNIMKEIIALLVCFKNKQRIGIRLRFMILIKI